MLVVPFGVDVVPWGNKVIVVSGTFDVVTWPSSVGIPPGPAVVVVVDSVTVIVDNLRDRLSTGLPILEHSFSNTVLVSKNCQKELVSKSSGYTESILPT